MPWGAVAGAAVGLIGSSMQADAAGDAAQQQANAQLEAARIQADASKFRPVGITNRFGNSNYTFDDNGYLSSAGYTLSPDLQRLQEAMLANAGGGALNTANQGLQAGRGLFNLGQSYMAQSPQQAAQQWMTQQQDLLAPSRDRAFAGMLNQNYQQGTTGLSVGATGTRPGGGAGLNAANPLAEAYFNSIAQQDAGLASQAQQQGQNQSLFGYNLMNNALNLQGTSMNPLQNYLNMANTIDKLGSNTLDMGAQLGGRTANANQAVGQALAQGLTSSAATMAGVNGNSAFGNTVAGLAGNQNLWGKNGAFNNWLNSGSGSSGTFTPDTSAYSYDTSGGAYWN